ALAAPAAAPPARARRRAPVAGGPTRGRAGGGAGLPAAPARAEGGWGGAAPFPPATSRTDTVRGTPTMPSEAEGLMPPMIAGGATSSGQRVRRRLAQSIWEIPTGGPAVLTPSYEPDLHDPGPGVIGIDR